MFLGLAAAAPLVVLHRALQEFLVIERFAIYGLVAVVPLLVLGTEGVLEALLPPRMRRVGVAVGLALFLVAFQVFVAPQTRMLLERPQVPSREVADFLAAAGEGIPGGVIRAGVGLGGDTPDVYDPFVVARPPPRGDRRARAPLPGGGPPALRLLRLRRTEPAPVQADLPGVSTIRATSSRWLTSGRSRATSCTACSATRSAPRRGLMQGAAPGQVSRVLAALLGPRGTALRFARLALGGALLALVAWLLGPLRPSALPGAPTLVPREGQSQIHTVLVAKAAGRRP